ncbi:hypothetical protein CEP51_007306 [Fusarium floridanum]|uniref:Heterokaryon incompatibility domain-containing protein n=1 Tax=Fusarium floridanum TaxID=1325733 RepID=A0A428RPR0_9HYPO|nr:hypothetical protein CEP51_007306 [Fusarium floridanum]
MDYIPLPSDPIGTPLAVPLLNHTGYDGRIRFVDYPEHQGWGKRTAIEWIAVFERPTPHFQAFLQRWLLFCPLRAFAGQEFDVSDLRHIDASRGEAELTLAMLPQLAEQWLEYDPSKLINRSIEVGETLSHAMNIQQLLSSADPADGAGKSIDDRTQYSLVEYISLRPGRKDPCHPLVSIALSSLLTFIRAVFIRSLAKITGKAAADRALINHCVVYQWRSPIWADLLQRGWCPSELTPMSVRFNTMGLAFMARVERPISSRNHKVATEYPSAGGRLSRQGSQLCSSFTCVHRRLQDSTYTTAHVHDCKGCPTILARMEQMSTIFTREGGSFPLVVSVDEQDHNAHVRLVPWEPGVRYTAISHVWSDGLGNVNENGIPRCQLQRLSRYVRNLVGNSADAPLFWLDSLCVPPDASCEPPEAVHERKLQDLAMAKMRDTYRCSTATLVLDAWLLSTRSAGMTDAEKMMRIFSCAWNSRLWTYQEGALPDALFFQFEDVAENLDDMQARLEGEIKKDAALRFTLGERLLFQYHSLRGFRNFDPRSENFILFILSSMAFRSTSVATDEALCLSTLMGLDMDAMLRIQPEQRMAALWRQVPYAPSSLLLSVVPTLDEPGLSWAPYSTLLVEDRLSETGSLNTLPDASMSRSTTLTPQGLQIECPALVIRCGNLWPQGNFLVKDNLGFFYHVRMVLHKTLISEMFRGFVTVLIIHSYDKVHDCVQPEGVVQPLLLKQPPVDGLMIGRKIGIAAIRRLTPTMDAELLEAIAFFESLGKPIDEVGDVRMFEAVDGQNMVCKKWCVA